jgi:carbamoyl-phosphate synthase large subunit
MNILITSSSSKVLLVKQFKKVASNYPNILIYSGDTDEDSIAGKFSDKHIIMPKDNDPEFINKIIKVCYENKVEVIIPTRDEELKIYASNIKLLNKWNIQPILSSLKSIEICQNKEKFFKFCENNNIDTPKTYWDVSNIKYPAFAKPIFGKASKGVFKVNLETELPNLKENIIQEYINWREYTVDLFSDFDGNVISVVPRKRIKIVDGESHIGETENNEFIIKKSINLAKKLNLIGHNVIQCFYKKGKVKFIEVNPRFGGASNLGFESGADTPDYLIKLLKGEVLEPKIGNFTDKLKMYRHTTDVFENDSPTNKIFCIDIDGTLCTENTLYEDAQPIKKVIKKINSLYKNNTIILFTARGAASGYDWKPLTEKQLKKWKVKYHNLIMGKPYADYYIDNKAINVLNWI